LVVVPAAISPFESKDIIPIVSCCPGGNR
jgi:hypothetical protein